MHPSVTVGLGVLETDLSALQVFNVARALIRPPFERGILISYKKM